MQAMIETRWRTLSSPAAASLLRNPRVLRLLEAFMNDASTLRPVAARLNIPLPTAHRLVNRMIAAGVLAITGTVARPGRAMKVYGSSSGAFFVPRSAERRELPEEVMRRLIETRIGEQITGMIEAAREALGEQAAIRWGTVIYTDRNGQLVVRPDFAEGRTPKLLEENTPAYLNFYLNDLRLSQRTAKQLQRELVELVKRHKASRSGGAYTLSVVMAPRPTRR
jgi:hypothetical protein